MIKALNQGYKLVARALIGILGGFTYWTPFGIIVTGIIFWLLILVAETSSALAVWVLVASGTGAIIGVFFRFGGGLVSGILTGALFGYSFWYIFEDPAQAATFSNLPTGDLFIFGTFVALGFGSVYGAVGGAVGGMFNAIVGESPVPPVDHQLSRIFWLMAIGGQLVLALSVSVIGPATAEFYDFALLAPDALAPGGEHRLLYCLLFPGMFLFAILSVRLLWILDRKFFQTPGAVYITEKPFRDFQTVFREQFLAMLLGVLFEGVNTFLTDSFSSFPGYGLLFGLAVAKFLENLISTKAEGSQGPGRSKFVFLFGLAAAALLATGLQLYVLPNR